MIDNSQGIKTKLIYSFLNSITEWQKSRWRGFGSVLFHQVKFARWIIGFYKTSDDHMLVVIVQSLSCVWLFATPWTAARQGSLSFTISLNLLKLMSIEWVMPSNHLMPYFPLLLLPSIFPSIRVFSNELALRIRWQSIGASASTSVFPMNIQGWFPLGWTGLISLQSKGLSRVFSNTIVWKHQFSSAQASLWSNSHICTWLLEQSIALTIWAFVDKVISLLFNTLSRFVIAILPKSKCLLILWLQPLSVLIL